MSQWTEAAYSESDRNNSRQRSQRESAQDIYSQAAKLFDAGVVNPDRRIAASKSFVAFCKTYGGPAFNLGWASFHYAIAERVEEAVFTGAQRAFAAPRGSGKTTLARWGMNWAGLNGHAQYSVLIGKTASSAGKLLKSIKSTLRFNPLLREDYPEYCLPIHLLKGEVRRAAGQKFRGEPTSIEWGAEQIVLPTLLEEYYRDIRQQSGVESFGRGAGSIIDVCGVEGEIRGRQYERQDGEIIRPTFAMVDDPQDRESARSPGQCDEREQTIKADVAYLAGPDRPTGVVVPCTVIYLNDLADRLLDVSVNPQFCGHRSKMLDMFPTRLDLWEQYQEIRNRGHAIGDNGLAARKFYEQHRGEMNEGAVATWPDRFHVAKNEITAVQHAMNLYFDDEQAFMSEYQNEPISSQGVEVEIPTANEISQRTNGVERGVVPSFCARLFGFVDVSQSCLWWLVLGVGDGMTSAIVDYGVFPEQARRYVTLATIRRTLEGEFRRSGGQGGFEAALRWGLNHLLGELSSKTYYGVNGGEYSLERGLVDTNWHITTPIVNEMCSTRQFAGRWFPSRGKLVTSPDDGLVNPNLRRKPGEIRGERWKMSLSRQNGRHYCLYDVGYWKTFLFNRFGVAVGDPGALSLCDERPGGHKMLCEQLTAETCRRKEAKGFEYDLFEKIAGRDEHLLDCAVGAFVASSTVGMSTKAEVAKPQPKQAAKKTPRRKRVQYAEG